MKSFLLSMIVLALTAGVAHAGDAETVQAQATGFYRWYVHLLNANPRAEPRNKPEIHRYVSERLLKETARQAKSPDGLEADPFTLSQDWDPAWEKMIRLKDSQPDGAKWKVKVILGGGKEMAPQPLNLVLVREGDTWKIDKVSDGDAK